VVEYRNQAVVAAPLGLADPASTAGDVVFPWGLSVLTEGASGVVKLISSPNEAPSAFVAAAQ
jgi:hypothetical protein